MASEIFATEFNYRRQDLCSLLGRRWMPHIVLVLSQGAKRHGEVLAQIPGITQRVMGDRLRELEEAALAVRQVGMDGNVRYALTEAGHVTLDAVAKAIIDTTEPSRAGQTL